MKVSNVEKLEKSRVALTIEADAAEFEAAIQKAYQKERGRIQIPGFRRGKAPRKLIERMYGSSVFYESAINEVYPELFKKAVEQEKLDTVGSPEAELLKADQDGFSVKATVAIRPEVKLGEYKGLTAPREAEQVTEKDVDQEMAPLIERATRLMDADREAGQGDVVTIDFEGFMDGKAFEGGKGENYDLELGSGSFIPGFEDQLIGTKAEEEKDVTVTFPTDYGAAELAGKEAVFRVKVRGVKEKVAPEIDDEFAKDVSEFETLEELRADLEKKLIERREAEARSAFEDSLLQQVVDGMECEVPDAMVELRINRILEDYARQITNQGVPFEQYLAMTGLTPQILRTQAADGALLQVKVDLALKAVAKAEQLEVTAEEIDAEIRRMADQSGMEFEKLKGIVSVEELRNDLLNRKAANIIFDSAKVGKAPARKDEKKDEKDGAVADEEKPKRTTRRKKAEETKESEEGKE